ncbi:MAG: HlyC/CorC family transporter [Gammaproteobacteria bacterium]|nr:MAG: HlyC/CorC family transporter [Gammaproteobacteria bacterium]
MEHVPLWQLLLALCLLITCSAFFSGSETGMMALDRYRLRHLSRKGHRRARMASDLLAQPDRLIGLILFGNNLVNIMASVLASLITIRLFGDGEGVLFAMSLLLTFVVLIFAEVTPKTIAALYPDRIAFATAPILKVMMWPLLPVIRSVNLFSNAVVRSMGFDPSKSMQLGLSKDELRSIVDDQESIPEQHQDMLLNILDLEKASVNDIMIPKNDMYGINLDESDDAILERIHNSPFTRILAYHEDTNNVVGIIHLRHSSLFIRDNKLVRSRMLELMREPYFVPESTPLHTQLFNFQKEKRRIGIVVDEYGDVIGLVTLEDILEDIVGEFTVEVVGESAEIQPQADGNYRMEGSVSLRDINRALDWELPTSEAKTLNGLLLEQLEEFPDGPVCVSINRYRFQIESIGEKSIESVLALKDREPASKDSTAS